MVEVLSELVDPLPGDPTLRQPAQSQAPNMAAECAECLVVGRRGVVIKKPSDDQRQPTFLFGNRLVHSPP